ncbi:MAG: amidase, partial [Comamonas sp.]
MMSSEASTSETALHCLSAGTMAAGFATGRWTPLQVWQSLRSAIGDDPWNAYVLVDDAGAVAQAEASTRRWQQGKALSPLDGVPVSIKDLVMQQGLPTGRGSRLSNAAAATVDAPVVQQLRAAGAVLFAKTTTTEMGCSIHGDSPAHGRTLHPLDTARSVGGSSCGAAAQLAAGWGPLAIGSDAGGSVRIPASYAGLT